MKKENQKPNRLVHESSPYLQQHAYNPVDWYPWGAEALDKAKAENKPILVSIGYSTCHWCHVMERESFEDAATAAYMNEHFINIKVDREERPDVDSIYMEAVQLIQNGQGGWPLNCFLLPNGMPFFGGTYFPPQPAYQRASWMQVLQNLSNAFKDRKEDVEAQAQKLMHYMRQAQTHFTSDLDVTTIETWYTQAFVQQTFISLSEMFDNDEGGFGGAPKFPGTMGLHFCLNYYLAEQNEKAFNHLILSLDKMAMGGIFDHLGGGFARYTVDDRWLVPHFEKMLYDNALLVGLYADTYKLEPKALYQQRIEETLGWVEREMLATEGGFYSALDADSEGVEGKFYVWDLAEIKTVLGADSNLFCAYYDITEEGNWEHKNIINMPQSTADFLKNYDTDLTARELERFLQKCREQLLTVRAKRIRPGLDDKILLDWNVMMITAYCKAYQALNVEVYRSRALTAMDFILSKFRISEETLHLYHSYKDGVAKHHAFLDDYALLIEALLEVYAITQDDQYLSQAKDYTDFVLNEFLDHKDNLCYFTSAKQQDIILHKKAVYDGATPSGNAVMVHNLLQLARLLDESSYQEQAVKSLTAVQKSIKEYPQSFGRWADALFALVYPQKRITIHGPSKEDALKKLSAKALLNTVITTKEGEWGDFSNVAEEKDAFIVCKNQTCALPVSTIEEALGLL